MVFCYTKYNDLDKRGEENSIKWEFTSNLDGFTNSKKFWLASGEINLCLKVHLLVCQRQRLMCCFLT